MLPIKDNVPTRRFPILTVALIVANVLVFVLYEQAGRGAEFVASVDEGAYQPCEVEGSCGQIGLAWPINLFTSMFMHGDWAHLLGNVLFLWVFGNNVEDTLGRIRFLVFYALGGIAATALQTFVTLQYGTELDASIPNLGASGAIAAVLGAYIVLHPTGRVLTWIAPIFLIHVPAVLLLGIWFAFQLFEGGYSFTHPEAGGGIAYFAHIGGFMFGVVLVRFFQAGRPPPLQPSH